MAHMIASACVVRTNDRSRRHRQHGGVLRMFFHGAVYLLEPLQRITVSLARLGLLDTAMSAADLPFYSRFSGKQEQLSSNHPPNWRNLVEAQPLAPASCRGSCPYYSERTVMSSIANYVAILISVLLVSCGTTGKKDPPDEPATPGIPTRFDLATTCDVTGSIAWMDSQKIIYTQARPDEWRDCSGNFLRLSSRIAASCPGIEMAAPEGITRYKHGETNTPPGKPKARTTRGLAKWYDDQGLFEPVFYDEADTYAAPGNLVKFRNQIKPGTVFWFSPGAPKSSDGKSGLYAEVGGAINHMGTVASITKDSDGNVVGWTMYHGQNARKHNGITTHKWEKSGNRVPVPQGGYGSQRIVGYAPYIVPSKFVSR